MPDWIIQPRAHKRPDGTACPYSALGACNKCGWCAEFPSTIEGGHALIIEFGDEVLTGSCQCGQYLGSRPPNSSADRFAERWERHVMSPELRAQRAAAAPERKDSTDG